MYDVDDRSYEYVYIYFLLMKYIWGYGHALDWGDIIKCLEQVM